MYDKFQRSRLPVIHFNTYRARRASRTGTWLPGEAMVPGTAPELYFRWLRDDAQLAQQVADAWNELVQRGDADLVKCYCRKCFEPVIQPSAFP